MAERVKRPFWLHQMAEYIIGIALIGSGLQSPSPAIPAALGGLILLNAALVEGPLGAFRVVGRRLHRVLDVVLVVLGLVGAVVPGIDMGTRIIIVCCVFVLVTVVLNTNYSPARRRSGSADRESVSGDSKSDDIGRTAGRVAGTLAGQARAKWQSRHNGDELGD